MAGQCAQGTTEWARAVLELEAAAERQGVTLGSWDAWSYAEAASLLKGDAAGLERCRRLLREDPEWLRRCVRAWSHRGDISALVPDLLDAARRREVSCRQVRVYDFAYLWPVLLEANRPREALRLIERTSPAELNYLLDRKDPCVHWEECYGEVKPLLALIASQSRPGERVDAFLRGFANIEPSTQVSFSVWRLRDDLSRDEGFRRLPSADYVLSCLYDPVIEPEQFHSLCRSAVRSGCRSRALLIDLIEEGEPLLDELAAVDPVAARLECAKRSEGGEGLAAFLDSDDMTEDQFEEARREHRRRRSIANEGTQSASPPVSALDRFELESSRREIADPERIVWEVLLEAPPSRWTLNSLRRGAGYLPPAIEEKALEVCGLVPEEPGGTFFRTRPPAAKLAQTRPSFWDDWRAAASHVFETEGKEGIRRLLSGRFGRPIARWMCERKEGLPPEELAELVRAEGLAHPMDLGWLQMEEQLLKDRQATDPRRREIALKLLDVAKRDPSRAVGCLPHLVDAPEKTELSSRALAMFDGLSPAHVIPLVHGWSGHPVDARFADVLLGWATTRCRTVEDRLALCDFLNRLRRKDEADRLEAEFLRDEDPHVVLRVLGIRRGWQRTPGAVDPFLQKARAGTWTTSQARQVWVAVCNGAAQEGREDLFVEALDEMWRIAPLDCGTGFTSGSASTLVHDNAAVNEMTARIVGKGEAPLSVLHLARRLGRRALAEDLIEKVKERLARVEPLSPEAWLDTLAGLPRVQILERLDAALRLMSGANGRQRVVAIAVCTRLRQAGRLGDLLACADLWGTTRPASDVRSWQAPPEASIVVRGFSRYEEATPPMCVLPKVPPGVHALPPAASAAEFLVALGLTEAAGETLGRAAAGASDPVSREACRFEQAKLCADGDRTAEAMRTLLELRDGSTGRWLRAAAAEKVSELFRKDAHAREAFIAATLGELASIPQAPEDELRAWGARLASDEEPERERATEELRGMREAALGVLRDLRSSRDPEVRARVEDVLEQLLAP